MSGMLIGVIAGFYFLGTREGRATLANLLGTPAPTPLTPASPNTTPPMTGGGYGPGGYGAPPPGMQPFNQNPGYSPSGGNDWGAALSGALGGLSQTIMGALGGTQGTPQSPYPGAQPGEQQPSWYPEYDGFGGYGQPPQGGFGSPGDPGYNPYGSGAPGDQGPSYDPNDPWGVRNPY